MDQPTLQRWFCVAMLSMAPLLDGRAAPSPGTARMHERLEQWVRDTGPRNPYDNSALLASLRARIPQTTDFGARFRLEYKLAWELLNAGEAEESLAIVNRLARTMHPSLGAGLATRRIIWQLQALASLRVGELENCLGHHHSESCLIPVSEEGEHVQRRGSELAKGLFLRLARRSNDLGSRWLLNIAAMTNVLTGLLPDRFYEVQEGENHARALSPARFDWPSIPVADPHLHAPVGSDQLFK